MTITVVTRTYALLLLVPSMSLVFPSTPQRSVLHAHPQAMSPHTVPAGIHFHHHLNKSPSLRASAHQHATLDSKFPPTRPSLLHKKSHPLPNRTPDAYFSGINKDTIQEQTATAPARVPVPKRPRPDDDSDLVIIDELDEEEVYRLRQREAGAAAGIMGGAVMGGRAGPSRQGPKRPRHESPMKTAHAHENVQQLDDDTFPHHDTLPPTRNDQPPREQPSTSAQPRKRPRPPPSPQKAPAGNPAVLDVDQVDRDRVTKKHKMEKRVEREQAEEKFRDKYTRAFPNFKFYFDSIDGPAKSSLTNRVLQLGAVSVAFELDAHHPLSHPVYSSASKTSSQLLSPTSSPTRTSRPPKTSLL